MSKLSSDKLVNAAASGGAMINDLYRDVIRHDSFRAGYNHGDQGHEMDLFRSQFDAPEDFEAWFEGWCEGRDHGPHRPGHPDPAAAEKAWQQWSTQKKRAA